MVSNFSVPLKWCDFCSSTEEDLVQKSVFSIRYEFEHSYSTPISQVVRISKVKARRMIIILVGEKFSQTGGRAKRRGYKTMADTHKDFHSQIYSTRYNAYNLVGEKFSQTWGRAKRRG